MQKETRKLLDGFFEVGEGQEALWMVLSVMFDKILHIYTVLYMQ